MENIAISGYGQFYTDKPKNGVTPQFIPLSFEEIRKLVDTPQSREKQNAQWAIFSTLPTRVFKSQEEKGLFQCLWFDSDESPKTLDKLCDDLAIVMGVACQYEAYTSKSATKTKQKSRLLIPLDYILNGHDFLLCQEILNDKLEALGVKPDRATERAAQLCYLPNKGEYYHSYSKRDGALFDPLKAFKSELSTKKKAIEEAEKAIVISRSVAKSKRAAFKANGSINGTPIIQLFNDQYLVEDVLLDAGYDQKGSTFRHPGSESGSYSASVLNSRVHALSPADPLHTDTGAHDAFSAYAVLNYNGNQKQAEIAFKQTLPKPPISKVAAGIKAKIEYGISNLGFKGLDLVQLDVCAVTIDLIISKTFWNPTKGKYLTLTDNGVLNMYAEKEVFKFLCDVNGNIFNHAHIAKLIEDEGSEHELYKIIKYQVSGPVLDYMKGHSQRTSLEMRVDMFATVPRIEMREELARVVYTHKPYVTKSILNQAVVDDYKEHFPYIDDFLTFLVASRFARDRKKSYLWFKCTSDWGKGFLMGLLDSLDMTTELSVKEVEKIFEGQPVGKSMHDFKRCLALVFDEFKQVKSELKQLQSEISMAPKNQLSFKVEVFSKLFFSAESVNSLVTEHGVEDQFINRFNHFDMNGDITKRPLYMKLGSGAYMDGLRPYVVEFLNTRIAALVAKGKAKAEYDAEGYLNKFMLKYGLENTYCRLSESIDGVVVDIAKDIAHQCTLENTPHITKNDKGIFLKSPAKYIENYIDNNFAHSDKVTILRKRNDIINLLSIDKMGCKSRRITKYESVKCVLIDPTHLKK